MSPIACSICGDPAIGAEFCPPCAGLLRWVRGYFADEPKVSALVQPGTRFVDDLGVESLDYMEWLLEAEEKLDIAISDHQAERIKTVGEFVRSLKEAGARWPDNKGLRIVPGRWWCSSPHWEVVERPPNNSTRPE